MLDLRLVPLSTIKLQEEVDLERLGGLVEAFKKSQILIDPPVVTKGLGKRLMQIDGANRISILRLLGCSHVVVQFVDYQDTSQVSIKSWTHVSKVNKSAFTKKLRRIEGAKTERFKLGLGVTLTGHPLASATVIFRDGNGLSVYPDSNLYKRVKLMRRVVKLYEESIVRDNIVTVESRNALTQFFKKHKDSNVALLFPTFSSHEIYSLLERGITLPTGVTRHLINERVLRINYPLEMLKKQVSAGEKEKYFKKFLSNLNLRFYEESTYIVE